MSQDHLEDRLQALLDGSGLTLPARPDATGVVLGRVRRARRRRRALQAAVPAVLVVAAVAAGMAAVPHHEETPAVPVADNILTGTGIGPLHIGMSLADARKTGLVTEADTDQGLACVQYNGKGSVNRVFVAHDVVAEIWVDTFAETPAGIHTGDTYGELLKAYPKAGLPNAQEVANGLMFDAPGGGGNQYEVSIEQPDPNSTEPQPEGDERKLTSLGLRASTESGFKC